MKKLTIQFLCLAMVMMAVSVSEAFAQKIRFKNGKATVRAKVKAKSKKTFRVSGKDFKKLSFKQTKGKRFKYEIRRGSEFLSSGHTTGIKLIKSDGKSTYSITIINKSDIARSIALSFVESGGSPKV